MQDKKMIPRWVVENDPSWEKSIDSDLGMLKWTKKRIGIQATCLPTEMLCEIVGETDQGGILESVSGIRADRQARLASVGRDIAKYLSSRYLNPAIDGPRFDFRNVRKF
jgi:hypothetical protein